MLVICMKHKLFVYFKRLVYFTFNVECGILAITILLSNILFSEFMLLYYPCSFFLKLLYITPIL